MQLTMQTAKHKNTDSSGFSHDISCLLNWSLRFSSNYMNESKQISTHSILLFQKTEKKSRIFIKTFILI